MLFASPPSRSKEISMNILSNLDPMLLDIILSI